MQPAYRMSIQASTIHYFKLPKSGPFNPAQQTLSQGGAGEKEKGRLSPQTDKGAPAGLYQLPYEQHSCMEGSLQWCPADSSGARLIYIYERLEAIGN